MIFQEEAIEHVKADLFKLMLENWQQWETKEGRLNWEWYFRNERNGSLKLITMRNGTELCGYAILLTQESLYADEMMTVCQQYYIVPIFNHWIRSLYREIIKRSIGKLYISTQSEKDSGNILSKLGLTLKERVYCKG